ncbi:MAG TPA: hypothetical protein DCZ10_01430 [Pelotomaculum sp.]|nr:hypothetical protein [Pelotomaculum sp.]
MLGGKYRVEHVKRALYFKPEEFRIGNSRYSLIFFTGVAFLYFLPGFFLLALLLILPAAALRLPVAPASPGWVTVDLIFITLGVGLHEWFHVMAARRLLGAPSVEALFVVPNRAKLSVRLRPAPGTSPLAHMAVLLAGPLGAITTGFLFLPLLFLMNWPLPGVAGWALFMAPHVLSLRTAGRDTDGSAFLEILKNSFQPADFRRVKLQAASLALGSIFRPNGRP